MTSAASRWVFAVSLALLATTINGQSCIGTPPDPTGGSFVNDCNGGTTVDGGNCTAACLVGFVGSPTPSATCTAGTWGAVSGSCVAINNCAPLDRPDTCAAAGPPCCWSKSSKVCVSCTAVGSECCPDGCISLVYSSLNCGGCGIKCDSKYSCKNSTCVRSVFKP